MSGRLRFEFFTPEGPHDTRQFMFDTYELSLQAEANGGQFRDYKFNCLAKPRHEEEIFHDLQYIFQAISDAQLRYTGHYLIRSIRIVLDLKVEKITKPEEEANIKTESFFGDRMLVDAWKEARTFFTHQFENLGVTGSGWKIVSVNSILVGLIMSTKPQLKRHHAKKRAAERQARYMARKQKARMAEAGEQPVPAIVLRPL